MRGYIKAGGLAWVAAGILVCGPAVCQTTFTTIPDNQKALYKFNFARNFFTTPQQEVAQRAGYAADLVTLGKLKGHVTSSAQNLYRAMALADRVTADSSRHAIYLYLRYAVDTRNTDSHEEESQIFSDVASKTSFLQQELMRLTDTQVAQFVRQEPRLKQYDFELFSARRLRPHTLSLSDEELLNTTAPLVSDWVGELYSAEMDNTPWGTVETGHGALDVRKQAGALGNSTDRSVREAAFKKMYAGFASRRDLYAFGLIKLIKARNMVSALRHYKDYPGEAHFGIFLTTPQVKNLFSQLTNQGDFNKQYQQIRAERIKQVMGYPDVNVWDLSAAPPGLAVPRFTMDECTADIKAALAPLGAEWEMELGNLLDPRNGRLDIVGGDHRVPGAFSWGFPGSQTSIFYSYNYEGFYQDVDTLAHESGHAVHFQLMGNSRVLPVYTQGPSYFTESFAMFNELLFGDYMYNHESNPLKKTYFLEQFMAQAMSLFGIVRQASIEQAAYDGVEAGSIHNADDFDTMAMGIGSRLSIWYPKDPELKMEWIAVHHFYDSPMYYVNYVFAQFLALKYYELYKSNPQQFLPRYVAMVRNGFNGPPADILQKFLGISLEDPNLVSGATKLLSSKVDELKALYAASPPVTSAAN